MDKPYKNKIAAVVVTYNRKELLKGCITSLRNQTRKLDEIIVVNNDSTDGTKEWLDEQKDLTVIHQANLGGAGGFHTGIKTAYEKGYDWIWCMEDELLALKNTLSILLDNFSQGIVALAPIRKNRKTKEIYYSEIIKFDKRKCKGANRYQRIKPKDIGSNKIKIFSATFEGLLIKAKIISQVGYPNKDFFIWYDDLEYCMKLNQHGKIYYIPTAIIFKNNNVNNANLKNEYRKMMYGLRNLIYIEINRRSNFFKDALCKNLSILNSIISVNKYYFFNRKVIGLSLYTHIKIHYEIIQDILNENFSELFRNDN